MAIDRDSIISYTVNDLNCWNAVAGIAVEIFKTEPTPGSLDATEAVLDAEKDWIRITENKNLEKGAKFLSDFFEEYHATDDQYHFIERLEVQFAGMFYGVSETPVFMIESVQLGREHTLYEKPYFQVEEEFETWGYKGMPEFNEPFDHACQELAYMIKHIGDAAVFLADHDFDSYQERAEAIVAFSRDHYDKWIPDVSKQILAQSCSKYYKAGAYLLIGLGEVLKDYFASVEALSAVEA